MSDLPDHPVAEPSPRALALAAKVRWGLVVLALGLAVLGVVLGAGWLSAPDAGGAYSCPMHPEIRADAPGTCPICQMDLVPLADVPAQGTAPASTKLACPRHPEIRSDVPGVCPLDGQTLLPTTVPGRGLVHIGDEAARRIGVVLVPAVSRSVTSSVRALGLVATDPARTAIAQSRFAGFVTRLSVTTPFTRVRRGQALASLTSTDLYRAEAELATARDTAVVLGEDGDRFITSAQARLDATGLSSREVARVAGGGAPRSDTQVIAPRAGTVLDIRVSVGEMVTPGMPLYVISDLSRLFVNADVPADEATSIRAGMRATVFAPGVAAPIEGVVELVEPVIDPSALVRRVRVIVEQADETLVPGARVEVVLLREPHDAILVPEDSVLVDGARHHVFVVRDDGLFEARVVVTGGRVDREIEILSGLRAGDRVASVAAFLIDAESQIRGTSP